MRRDAQRNRERILTAARTLFAERGVEASLDELAHVADVGVGTVYRHYPTKDALLDELFETTLDELAAYAEAAAAEPDSWTAFTGFLEHLAEAFADNRALETIVLQADRGEERAAAARERLEAPVLTIIDRAKRDGALPADFGPDDVGLIHKMLAAVIRETHDESPELWRRYFALIVDGLNARRA